MAEPKSLEQIAQEVRNLSYFSNGISELNPNRTITTPQTQKGFSMLSYDIPREALYNRLSDGTYVPKFENYVGATGNEERLAWLVVCEIHYHPHRRYEIDISRHCKYRDWETDRKSVV